MSGLAILCLAGVVWGVSAIRGQSSLPVWQYSLMLGIYGVASAVFVIPRVKVNSSQLFDLPVFITLTTFLQFGLIPLYFLLHPQLRLHGYLTDPGLLTRALFYFVLGMVAFWAGSSYMRSHEGVAASTESGGPARAGLLKDDEVLLWLGAIYLPAVAVRIYLLHSHLYSYTESFALYFQKLAVMQVLLVVTQFGPFALVLAAVETYWHPHDAKRSLLFYLVFTSECFWGLISGMKLFTIENFVLVALVSSLVLRRIRVRWMVAPLLVLVLIYPFNNQYRNLIRGAGLEVTSLNSAVGVASLAFTNALERTQSLTDWFGTGADSTLERLDLLQGVATFVNLGSWADPLRTRDQWWLLPIYSFIPRLLWSSKPQEDMGQKLSVMLHEDPNSCTSPTYPGDAYLEFGVGGVMVCMLLLGIFTQWMSRLGSGTLSKRRLFVFASLFLTVADLENDFFSYWTGAIRALVILSVIAWLVYRRTPVPRSVRTRVSVPCGKP